MTLTILDKVRSAETLPSLPSVAVEVLRLAQSDNLSVAQIARVIEQDPALTCKMLKVANSSLFGLSRQICSLQQAVVVLGLRTVKVMVLTFSLVDAMRQRETGNFDYDGYWQRSLTTAVGARLLADKMPGCRCEEAFVTGLLSDIGMLAAFHADRVEYEQVLRQNADPRKPLHVIEQELLGVSHDVIGGELLNTWCLPRSIAAAVASHHQPIEQPLEEGDEATRRTATILRAAVMITELFCTPSSAGQLGELERRVPPATGIAPEDLQAVLETLHKHVEATASVFSLDIGPTRSFQDIQAEAIVHLAKLSMTAELERAQLQVREQDARHQVEELSDRNRTLSAQATTDGLTGIANRAALDVHLAAICGQEPAQGSTIGVLMLDLDRFKKLNDTFGHQTGDVALKLMGNLLERFHRDGTFVARYGGEEFAVILTLPTLARVTELAELIQRAVRQLRIPHQDRPLTLTVSIGALLATIGSHALPKNELIELADKALYEAKQGGRNRTVITQWPASQTAASVGRRVLQPALSMLASRSSM